MSEESQIDRPGDRDAQLRARAALDRYQEIPAALFPRVRKPEDTSEGCQARADDDRARAAALGEDRMRFRLERSADVWAARAKLLARLENGRDKAEPPELS